MNGHPDYKKILDEMWDLHCWKATSYGSDDDPLANLRSGERFGVPAWKRCLVEAESAFYRTVNYCNGRNPNPGNLENALMDAAAFSMLALLMLREERSNSRKASSDDQFEAELAEFEKIQVRSGYRPPSEEIGNRMNEVLEKAK